MRWWSVAMDKRRRLENAHFILVCCGDFACIRTAVQRRNTYVVVCGARYDLDTFKGTGEDHYIAASSVCLNIKKKY